MKLLALFLLLIPCSGQSDYWKAQSMEFGNRWNRVAELWSVVGHKMQIGEYPVKEMKLLDSAMEDLQHHPMWAVKQAKSKREALESPCLIVSPED